VVKIKGCAYILLYSSIRLRSPKQCKEHLQKLEFSVVAVFTDPFARAGGLVRPFAALHAFSHGDAENSSSHSDLGDF
jgi:hypothetical protein